MSNFNETEKLKEEIKKLQVDIKEKEITIIFTEFPPVKFLKNIV